MNALKIGISIFLLSILAFTVSGQNKRADLPKVEIYQLWELEVENNKTYADPYRDVELRIQLKSKLGRVINHFGFYDGGNKWRIRFSPDELAEWNYEYWFTDDNKKISGQFGCADSRKPGRVMKNYYNPFWLGKGTTPKTQFRSFHTGDRFFAANWDDPSNPDDGNKRSVFLDWLQKNKYNMLSIGSFFTNRNEPQRGEGWDTPKLWPLNLAEYRKMETILDELCRRDITVFPFAGFFGARGEWPVEPAEQELYIKYTLARIGHYPNLILNVAGPEPFWREEVRQYKGAMRMNDLLRLGRTIDSLDVHNHILTVHNEKRATQYGDPFINEPWCDMSTLQGPTTTNLDKLYSGLIVNHPRNKVCYAQETLWAGNKNHPKYTNEQIRKNALTILFSGSILNYADMDGNSSTGFSGTLDLADCKQEVHEIVKKVWDWFESIPFHQLTARQDMVENGFCLANEGVEYYIYADTISKIELFLDFPYMFNSEWINGANPSDMRKGPSVNKKTVFTSPGEGKDWILHVYASKPAIVATGNFPDLAVDQAGNIHLVYTQAGLKYKKWDKKSATWTAEQSVGCACKNVKRSDPDIVIDSKGNPHVFCGNESASFDGKNWKVEPTKGIRDTELAIDGNDQLFLVSRGGNNGGNIGMETKKPGGSWQKITDPDHQQKGESNHVYNDLVIDKNNVLHLVQRYGPVMQVTYRRSNDGGKTWPVVEPVSNDRAEAPHIAVDASGKPIISTGRGYIFEREDNGAWKSFGRKVFSHSRLQPELCADDRNNIYLTAFGGKYNTRYNGSWMSEKLIEPLSENLQVGFVETAGADDFAYIVWEEGKGNAEEGLHDDATIFIGRLYPDGRIVGLANK